MSSLGTSFGTGNTFNEEVDNEFEAYTRLETNELLALKGDRSVTENHELRIANLERRISVLEEILNVQS